jgi:hypothetical protein
MRVVEGELLNSHHCRPAPVGGKSLADALRDKESFLILYRQNALVCGQICDGTTV